MQNHLVTGSIFPSWEPQNTNYRGDSYRYGFNGKENDNEVQGTGNQQDYGARVYDPRLGIFLSIDPLFRSYSFQSPYGAFNENPIIYNDPTGKGGELVIDPKNKTATLTFNMHLYPGNGLSIEELHAVLQIAFPDYKPGQSYIIKVPVEAGLQFQGNEPIPGGYTLEVIIIIDVIDARTVTEELKNNDASHNYFEVRLDESDASSKNVYPYNIGFFRTWTFTEPNSGFQAVNALIEELWHSTGAFYEDDPNSEIGKTGGHGDNEGVCQSGHNLHLQRFVSESDMAAFRLGSKLYTPQTLQDSFISRIPYKMTRIDDGDSDRSNDKYRAVVGLRATSPVSPGITN